MLNADDPLVAAVARRVRAHVAFFSLDADGSPPVRRHVARGGPGLPRPRGWLTEVEGDRTRRSSRSPRPDHDRRPGAPQRRQRPGAAGGARGLGATIEEVREGLLDFAPSAERSPGRLNLFRLGSRVVIVDFAHNEAGHRGGAWTSPRGSPRAAPGRTAPITAIIGTAGDRPDDTLRGIGRIAAQRAQQVAIKETLKYLRGRRPSPWSASCWPA